MSSRKVICRVRSLYAYESNDPSSLSFKPDSVIEVLAQLESGWWDGWCNGSRGWFPSNYVQVIKESTEDEVMDDQEAWELQQQWRHRQQQPRPRQRMLNQEMKNQLRLSLHTSDMLLQQNQDTPSISSSTAWVLQTTEDGSEQYYYNTETQDMRYSIPPELYLDDKAKQTLANSTSNGSLNNTFHQHSMDSFERPPVRPVRAANRVIADDYNRHHEEEFEDDERLPPNWVRKMTPKGRYYYCNLVTEQTTWALENIDPDTGILKSSLPDAFPTSPKYYTSDTNGSITHSIGSEDIPDEQIPNNLTASINSDNKAVPLSWKSLSSLIAHAILNLKESVRQHHNAYLLEDTTTIVHRIRLLLYASNCLEKETSIYLKSHKNLRTQHRALLSAVAKLILSTKVASNAWPTPESLIKLQSDAEDVLVAVRNFMTCAQELQIEIKEDKPSLTNDANELWRSFIVNKTPTSLSKSDLTRAIVVLADNVRGAMSSFMDSVHNTYDQRNMAETLAKLKANTPLLVAQFRNLSNTTSNFLNAVEEFGHVSEPHLPFLVKFKQPIYTAMGALFILSQTMTSADLDVDQAKTALDKLEVYNNTIETGLANVVEAAQKQTDELLENDYHRDTPTPKQITQISMNGSNGSSLHMTNDMPSQELLSEDEDKSDQVANVRQIGLSKLMSNSTLLLDNDVLSDETSNNGSCSSLNTDDITHNTKHMQVKKDAKIQKFFGEDTIAAARHRDTLLGSPTSTAAPSTGSSLGNNCVKTPVLGLETAWYLSSDIDPSEMILNMDGNVKGGSLYGLVQRLTNHDQLDAKFNTTFLLTYRSFCTTQELFNQLFSRYQLPEPEGLTQEELVLWREKKLKLVRLRVFNVIKSWLEMYYNEEEDRTMLPEIIHFTDNVIVESMKFGADQLTKLVKKRSMAENSNEIRKMKLNVRTEEMPPPILPKNMKRIKLLELDAYELARQMTIMDFRLYNRIKPVECLDKNWGKPDSDQGHIAANVKASIEHSNQVTAWVTDSILSKEEVKKRAVVLKHWINVADRCRYLNNYNTCMAILSAFDNGSIGRLKRTWELINGRSMQILQSIRRLMGSNRNFSEYRDIIHRVNPPCIPFLGIYLQDLTFIEDGNSNFLKKSNNLINFAKRMKTAEVIRELQQYQSTHYMLTAVPDIQEFIKTHLHSSREEEELYNLSLKLEPRERGEDTIARRLKESGL